jgi:hypothetical protein|tara:strand:- start:2 stop:733 length:732 start_codon:yes stop_codon:yes gene_type:complete
MLYFNDFPDVGYKFGDEVDETIFQNISVYAEVIDQIKSEVTFLNTFTIQEGFRPDQVSQILYDTPLHYWTFYLLNDDIREQGWPLIRHEFEEYIKKAFPNTTLTTRDSALVSKFKVGQTVTGNSSGASGKIIRRNIDLGQLIIEGIVNFRQAGETISSTNSSGDVESMIVVSSTKEFQSASHYVDGNNKIVDIDFTVGPGGLLTEKTHEDVYFAVNESLRQITVVRPELINTLSSSFKQAVRG